jgi:hypothetical protein
LFFATQPEGQRTWIYRLQDFATLYNNTVHNSIDRMPSSVTRENAREVFDYEESKRKYFVERKRFARYHVGDLVRVQIASLPGYVKNIFDKAAKAKWTKNLFEIIEIHYGTYVPMYSLQDDRGRRLAKRYYETEVNFVRHISED